MSCIITITVGKNKYTANTYSELLDLLNDAKTKEGLRSLFTQKVKPVNINPVSTVDTKPESLPTNANINQDEVSTDIEKLKKQASADNKVNANRDKLRESILAKLESKKVHPASKILFKTTHGTYKMKVSDLKKLDANVIANSLDSESSISLNKNHEVIYDSNDIPEAKIPLPGETTTPAKTPTVTPKGASSNYSTLQKVLGTLNIKGEDIDDSTMSGVADTLKGLLLDEDDNLKYTTVTLTVGKKSITLDEGAQDEFLQNATLDTWRKLITNDFSVSVGNDKVIINNSTWKDQIVDKSDGLTFSIGLELTTNNNQKINMTDKEVKVFVNTAATSLFSVNKDSDSEDIKTAVETFLSVYRNTRNSNQTVINYFEKAIENNDILTAMDDPWIQELLNAYMLANAKGKAVDNREKVEQRLVKNFTWAAPVTDLQIVTENDITDLLDGMTYYLFEEFREKRSIELLGVKATEIYDKIRGKMARTIAMRFTENNNLKKNAILNLILDANNPTAKANFARLVGFHGQRLSQFKMSVDKDIEEELNAQRDPLHDKVAFTYDTKNQLPPEVKLFMATAKLTSHYKDSNGNVVSKIERNALGLPMLAKFEHSFNYILKHVSGNRADNRALKTKLSSLLRSELNKYQTKATYLNSKVTDDFTEIVDALEKELSYPNASEVNRLSAENLLTRILFVNKLTTALTKDNPDFHISSIEGDSLRKVEQNRDNLKRKIVRKFRNGFIEKLAPTKGQKIITLKAIGSIKDNAYGIVTKLERVTVGNNTKYDSALKNTAAFLDNMGISVDNIFELSDRMNYYRTLNRDGAIMDGNTDQRVISLHDFITEGLIPVLDMIERTHKNLGTDENHPISQNPVAMLFSKYNKELDEHDNFALINKVAQLFVDAEADVTSEVISNQTLNVNGDSIYGITLNHAISNITNAMNNAVDIADANERKEALRKASPYMYTGYGVNSLWKKNLELGRLKITNGYLNGLKTSLQANDYKNMSPVERYAALINDTMRGIIHLNRAADRTVETVFRLTSPGGKPWDMIDMSGTNDIVSAVSNQYALYLEDEMTVRILAELGQGSNLNSYNSLGKKARFFDSERMGKFAEAIDKEILNIVSTSTNSQANVRDKVRKFISNNRNTEKGFEDQLHNFFDKKTNDNMQAAIDLGLDIDGTILGLGDEFQGDSKEYNFKKFTVLYDMGVIEIGKTLLGDPAFYKNEDTFYKRVRPMNGTRKDSIVSGDYNKVMEDSFYIKLRTSRKDADGKRIYENPLVIKRDTRITENDKEMGMKDIFNAIKTSSITVNGIEYFKNDVELGVGFREDYMLSGRKYWERDNPEAGNELRTMISDDVNVKASFIKDLDNDELKKVHTIEYDKKTDSFNYKDAQGGNIDSAKLGEFVNFLVSEFYHKDGLNNNSKKLAYKLRAYLKSYLKMTEMDGETYMTIESYRETLMRSEGAWSHGHQEAYRRMKLGLSLNSRQVALFRKLKTLGTGPLGEVTSTVGEGDDSRLVSPYILKHSVQLIDPAIVGKDTVLGKLARFMTANGIDMYGYDSANKVGTVFNNSGQRARLYDDDGNFTDLSATDTLNGRTIHYQSLNYSTFGIQLNLDPSYKDKSTVGTQYRKMILSNMFNQGLPADLSETDKINWQNYNEEKRKKVSPFYKVSMDYIKTQEALMGQALDKLIEELDIDITQKPGGRLEYKVRNLNKLVDILTQMGMERDYTANVLNSMVRLETPGMFVEYLADSEKIENVLFAIINNRIIKEKRKGTGAPQTSVTGWEITKRDVKFDNENTLRFYRKSKTAPHKTLPAEIMFRMPDDPDFNLWVKEHVKGRDKLKGLNNMLDSLFAKLNKEEDNGEVVSYTDVEKDLLNVIQAVGFRIPTQGMNSGDMFRIRRFLPKEAADTIVVPGPTVGKAGSDFDIDKLNMYFKNYKYNPETKKLVAENFDTELLSTPEKIDAEYRKYVNALKLPEDLLNLAREDKEVLEANEKLAELNESILELESSINDLTEYNGIVRKMRRFKVGNHVANSVMLRYLVTNYDVENGVSIDLMEIMTAMLHVHNGKPISGTDEEMTNIKNVYDAMIEEFTEASEDLDNNNPAALSSFITDLTTSVDAYVEYQKYLDKNYDANINEKIIKKKTAKDAAISERSAINTERKSKVLDKVYNMKIKLIESGAIKALTKEKWIAMHKDNLEKAHSKSALQNRMLDIHFEIMSMPANYRQLMSPITTALLDDPVIGKVWDMRFLSGQLDIAGPIKTFAKKKEEIMRMGGLTPSAKKELIIKEYDKQKAQYVTMYKNKNTSWNNIADPVNDIMKSLHFLSGKAGVGMAAVHVPHHVLAMNANLKFNLKVGQLGFDSKLINVDSNGNLSLAHLNSKDGDNIAETLSALVNAYVDVAADPFIFDLNAGQDTANIQFMMVRMGVPSDYIYKFLGQPIVKEYLKLNVMLRNNLVNDHNSKAAPEERIYNNTNSIIERTMANAGIEVSRAEIKEWTFNALAAYNNTAKNLIRAYANGTISDEDFYPDKVMLDPTNPKESLFSKLNQVLGSADAKSEILNNLTPEVLEENLVRVTSNDNDLVQAELIGSKEILNLFLKLQSLTSILQRNIRASSADTRGTGKNRHTFGMWEAEHIFTRRFEEFINFDKLLNQSPVSKAAEIVANTGRMYDDMLLVESVPKIKQGLKTMYSQISGMKRIYANSSEAERLFTNMKGKFLQSLVSNFIPGFDNESIFNTYMVISKRQDKVEDGKSYIERILSEQARNAIIKAEPKAKFILEHLSYSLSTDRYANYNEFKNKRMHSPKDLKFDMINYVNQNKSSITDDELTQSLEALRNNRKTQPIYFALLKISLAQSGFNYTANSFIHLFPEYDINYLKTAAGEEFMKLDESEQAAYMDEFAIKYVSATSKYGLVKADLQKKKVRQSRDEIADQFNAEYMDDFMGEEEYQMGMDGEPIIREVSQDEKDAGKDYELPMYKLSDLILSNSTYARHQPLIVKGKNGNRMLVKSTIDENSEVPKVIYTPIYPQETMDEMNDTVELDTLPIPGADDKFVGIDIEVNPKKAKLIKAQKNGAENIKKAMNKYAIKKKC